MTGAVVRGRLVATLVVALGAPLTAQDLLFSVLGDQVSQQFGSSAARAGDVDGDGLPDLIVGALADDTGGGGAGAAFVYSGIDGALIWSWFGSAANDGMGIAVDGAGDVNADGLADLIVGIYRDDTNGTDAGRATVYSGLDGSVLLDFFGAASSEFGGAVAGVGDIDGDGHDDIAVGAHHSNENGLHSGSVRVFSGDDGSLILLMLGTAAGDDLGHAIAAAGDVDGDGVPDIIAGAHDVADPGAVRVYSGADGSVLLEFAGNSNFDFFGRAVESAGDLNGDGHDDLLVGAPQDDLAGENAGRAWAYSGDDGSVLFEWSGDSPGDGFGSDVSGAGDFDGDGFPDVLVGAPGDDAAGPGAGRVTVFSGADGSVLATIDGDTTGARVDVSLDRGDDMDGDGRPEIIIGVAYDDAGAFDAGLVKVLSGSAPTWTSLGGGLAGAAGLPGLSGKGLLAVGTPGSLNLIGAAPLAPCVLFAALTFMPVPFKGGQLAAFPPVIQLSLFTGVDGTLALPWAAWPSGLPSGQTLVFQYAILDAGAPVGVALSGAITGTTK